MRAGLLLALLLLTACVQRICDCAAPMLGIWADRNGWVVHLDPGGAAERAGVQIGDRLIDIRPARVGIRVSLMPVPFERDAVGRLIGSTTDRAEAAAASRCAAPCPESGPLIMRVEREGREIELEIRAGYRSGPRAEEPQALPSPLSPLLPELEYF